MDIFAYLDEHHIGYQRCDHPPVYTCEEADRLVPPMPGMKTKNLFLCDDKGRRHFLVTVPDSLQVNLKDLAGKLGVKKLRFASAKRLQRHLDIEPGAVTLLAAANDTEGNVDVVMDEAIANAEAVLCHPLVNTSTLSIAQADLQRFLTASGHTARVLKVPARQAA